MSNYPDGVTGNEYEISGPTYEAEEEKECPNQQCVYVPVEMVRAYVATAVEHLVVAELGAKPLTMLPTVDQIRKAKKDLNDLIMELPGAEVEFPCEWSGDVDVQGFHYQKWWTCPRCGVEHTEDFEEPEPDERDPDEGRDD